MKLRFPVVLMLMLTLMLPLTLAEPVQIWNYSDQCAAFSVSFNSDGYVASPLATMPSFFPPRGGSFS